MEGDKIDDRTFIRYSSSILVIADEGSQATRLRQFLKRSGYQVYPVSFTSDERLNTVCQNYFELIILNIEGSAEARFEISKKLKASPELAAMPLVILIHQDAVVQVAKIFDTSPIIYCIPNDVSPDTVLSSIIEQIHYLIYRYM